MRLSQPYRYSSAMNASAAPTAMPRASRAISLAARWRFTYPLLSQGAGALAINTPSAKYGLTPRPLSVSDSLSGSSWPDDGRKGTVTPRYRKSADSARRWRPVTPLTAPRVSVAPRYSKAYSARRTHLLDLKYHAEKQFERTTSTAASRCG